MTDPGPLGAFAYSEPPPELHPLFYDGDVPIEGGEFLDRLAQLKLGEQDQALWCRMRWDMELFCVVCFPTRFTSAFNRMHKDILAEESKAQAWTVRERPEYRAIEAPRGGAKTTLVSYARVLRNIVYGLEIFTGMASTDYNLSETLVQDIYDTFKDASGYEEFHRIYGPFEVVGTKTDFYVRVPGLDPRGSKVKAYSRGGACRGHKHKGERFSDWDLDDFEHPKRVQNPDLRDEDERFIDRDIVRSGMASTRITMAGTAQDPDCVITRKRKNPAWKGVQYKAIISWPNELRGLWEECRAIWTDLTLGDVDVRTRAARDYYEQHRAEMDAGAEVMWPEREPLFDLMIMFWTDEHAFFAEMQNEPGRSAERTFDVDRFRRFKFDGETITRADGHTVEIGTCSIGVHLDPKRESKKGTGRDFACVAVVARDTHGIRYVLEERHTKGPMSEWLQMYFEVFEAYGPGATYTYETNEHLDLDADETFQRLQKRKWGHWAGRLFRPEGKLSRGQKTDRIARVQPDTLNGFLQFNETLSGECMKQFRHFPNGRNDDCPDAIERADHAASNSGPRVGNVRV